MKDKTSASLEALNGLLGERQRYEEWLTALESRKGNTPDSVYQRVRADYETRLKGVSDRLGARAGELKSNIDALTAKLQEISKQETSQHESRQEAELRAAVGEYSDDEWNRIKQDSEKELTRIAAERTAAENQLAELNRIFTLSTNPGAAVAAAPLAPVPPRSVSVSDQNGAKKSGTGGWPQREGDPSASTSPPSAPPPADRAAPSKPEAAAASPFDEFSAVTQKPPAAGSGTKKDESAPAASTTAKSKRGGLPDLRTEQQKTLKCPECGATNYPTEWYCERCGGELATL